MAQSRRGTKYVRIIFTGTLSCTTEAGERRPAGQLASRPEALETEKEALESQVSQKPLKEIMQSKLLDIPTSGLLRRTLSILLRIHRQKEAAKVSKTLLSVRSLAIFVGDIRAS